MYLVQTWVSHTEIISVHVYVPYKTGPISFSFVYVQILEQCLAYSKLQWMLLNEEINVYFIVQLYMFPVCNWLIKLYSIL